LQEYATVSVSDCKTIRWTSKDVAGMHYDIERQKQGESGFTKIGEQSGTGAVFQTHSYQFEDATLTAADGAVRYRIRQVLDTAASGFTAFYSDTVTVALARTCTPVPASENGVQIIPNPVQNTFYVKLDTGSIQNLHFVALNALGQTVYTKRTTKEAGIAVIPIEAYNLAPGLYYLVVYDAGRKVAAKPFLKL
jgi:hypothetical protein